MRTANELTSLFFKDLRRYNATNFKTIATADLTANDPVVHKAFSSVVTRYFIFKEKHPELTEAEHNILYFKLKLDLVARYFAEFPDSTPDSLVAFQLEVRNYVKENKGGVSEDEETEI